MAGGVVLVPVPVAGFGASAGALVAGSTAPTIPAFCWRKWATPWVALLPLNALFGNHRRPGPFVTRVATGLVKPAPQVLVLDYDVPGNLSAVRPIIDELVEIVPGANFGRALYRRGESYTVTAYFALHSATAHSD